MRKIKLYQTVKLITDKYEENGLKRGTLGNVFYICAFNIGDFE